MWLRLSASGLGSSRIYARHRASVSIENPRRERSNAEGAGALGVSPWRSVRTGQIPDPGRPSQEQGHGPDRLRAARDAQRGRWPLPEGTTEPGRGPKVAGEAKAPSEAPQAREARSPEGCPASPDPARPQGKAGQADEAGDRGARGFAHEGTGAEPATSLEETQALPGIRVSGRVHGLIEPRYAGTGPGLTAWAWVV